MMSDEQADARVLELQTYLLWVLLELRAATEGDMDVPLKTQAIRAGSARTEEYLRRVLESLGHHIWAGNLREHTPADLDAIIAAFERKGVKRP